MFLYQKRENERDLNSQEVRFDYYWSKVDD